MTGEHDVAWVVAGVLAASGFAGGDLTAEELRERLEFEIGPSTRWRPGPMPGDDPDDAAGRFLSDAMQPVARWRAPESGVVAAVRPRLGPAPEELLTNPRPGWAAPALRLAVGSLGDAAALREAGSVADVRLVPHLSWHAHRLWWRWPPRVGVVDPSQVAELTGDYGHLFTVEVVGSPGEEVVVEVLVLPDADGVVPDGVRAACVLVPGGADPSVDVGAVIDRLANPPPAALVLTRLPTLTWFSHLIAELAHDQPLDVAVALAVPESVVLADEMFLPLTSIRVWALRLAAELNDGELRSFVAHVPFDMEGRGSTALAERVRQVDVARGEPTIVRETIPMAGALPPEEPGEDEVDRGEGGDGGTAAAPDNRRLQAQVIDPRTKKPLADRFLPGTNQVRVRIAAEVTAGAVPGDALFRSPTPGRAAELTVEVVAGGRHAKRTLKLPAVKDSGWTKAVPVEVPAGATHFEVFVQVWFRGRVVQSAGLTGPVLDADAAPAAEPLRLSVDASTPPAAVHRMTPADASITIAPGLTGKPVALTFGQGQPIESDRLDKAVAGVRKVLTQAFISPAPAKLEDAAAPLTSLAIRGRLLHDGLRESVGDFPGDEAQWIQVAGLGSADLPLELVYTHPLPAARVVPVCGTALAGAKECVRSCPDRDRDDVVCPYGFWGTSKIVERRRHVDRRARDQAGSERTIAILTAAAVGVAAQADNVDKQASARIKAAVEAAVAGGGFHPLTSWDDLDEAVAAPSTVIVLITHTVEGDDDLGAELQIGTSLLEAFRVSAEGFLKPGAVDTGPVVIAIGCETADLDTSFTDYVTNLHTGGAELVVSAISPVPGKRVADFVVRLFENLPRFLEGAPVRRFGEVLTEVRRDTVATGEVLGLALTASGDGDVAIRKG